MTAKPDSTPGLHGLLARKGEARPAMRPHGIGALQDGDDLGWNDLGLDSASIPPVLRQRAQLQAMALGSDAVAVEPGAAGPAEAIAAADGVVTLHLDAGRMWRLRIAAAVRNMGVEALLVDALDQFLTTIPQIDALVPRLAPDGAEKGKP